MFSAILRARRVEFRTRAFYLCAILGCANLLPAACAVPASRAEAPRAAPREWREAARANRAANQPNSTVGEAAALPTTLDELIEYAVRESPLVRAARERLEASLERAPQVGGLPNPRLRGKLFLEEVETRVGPQEWAVGIEQQFPAFGVLDSKRKTADAQANAERANLDRTILEVSREVKLAWNKLYYWGQAIESVREDRDRLNSLEAVVRRDYSSGRTPYAVLIRAQVELGRSENRLAGLQDQRRPAVARLNAALHRSVLAEVPTPTELSATGELLPSAELIQRMEVASPQLAGLRHQKQAAEQNQRGAEFESRPAFSLGLEYIETGSAIGAGTPGSGDDPLIAMFSVDLPIHRSRYNAASREARARSRMVNSDLEAALDRLRAELEAEHFVARDAERQIELYQTTLLPRARQAFEATETAFKSGEANFLELIDSERVLLEFHLSLQRARTDQALAHARLEALVGDVVTRPSAPESLKEISQ